MENKNKNHILILKCTVTLLFPLVLCMTFCIIRGTSIFEMYAPDSFNNDSFFYYKMVQGVLENGFPKGFFGYNESRAIVGSFGVWSPLILIPWVIWGALFGWGYTSVFASNIFFFSLALVVFVILTKMEWKAMLSMFVLLSLIPSLPLHLLSCLPEANLLSFVTVFFGLAIGIRYRPGKKIYIVIMCLMCIVLTIIRPFMIILSIAPCYYLFKEKVKGAIIYTLFIIISGMTLYFLGSHYFSAPYFGELFDFSLFENILHGQWQLAYEYVIECIRNTVPVLKSFIKQAFDYGLTAGTQYVIAFITTAISFYHVIIERKTDNRIVHVMLIVMNISIIGAMIFLHGKVNEGGRHIFAFAIMGCMICCFEDSLMSYISKGLFVVVMVFFIFKGALVPTDYDIPIKTAETRNSIEYWERIFAEENIVLSESLGYENTLIWCDADYNELYATPKGIGVSCCLSGYVIDNFSELKSKYIAIPSGSKLDSMCLDSKFREIGRTEKVVIYQRY